MKQVDPYVKYTFYGQIPFTPLIINTLLILKFPHGSHGLWFDQVGAGVSIEWNWCLGQGSQTPGEESLMYI